MLHIVHIDIKWDWGITAEMLRMQCEQSGDFPKVQEVYTLFDPEQMQLNSANPPAVFYHNKGVVAKETGQFIVTDVSLRGTRLWW